MESHFHYKLFKPYGFLSQFVYNQSTRKNKKLLGELYNFEKGTMAIGRLDESSEGLLLLTTNGKLSKLILSKKVEKEYYVQVDGEITSEAIEMLKNGVEITVHGKTYTTLECKAHKLNEAPEFPERSKAIRSEKHGPTSWISITLKEGKFRQVRKMTAKVGFPTLRLVRYRVGNETCKDMKSGEVKEVKQFNYA